MTTNTDAAPSLTVTMRTRNRADYLRLAARSVLDQDFRDLELVISDDASTDGTPALCRDLERADPRVRCVRHDPPLGIYANWQFCYEQGRGRYYATLDDDNLYLPGFLAKAVAALGAHPQAAFAFADEWVIDGAGARLPALTEANSQRYKRVGRPGGLQAQADTVMATLYGAAGINSSVFRHESFAAVGGFRALAGELADFDAFLNLAAHGALSCYLPERLVEYRIHETQNTNKLVTNVPVARSSVALFESCRFEGAAERVRRQRLAIAYRGLGRAYLLWGDIGAASGALRSARRADPVHPVPPLLLSFLRLPRPWVRAALRRRYGLPPDAGPRHTRDGGPTQNVL